MGSSFDLARWFALPEDASGKEDDEVRERVLSDAYGASKVAYAEGLVMAKTPTGAVMLEKEEVDGAKLVWVDSVEDLRWKRVRFWMNESSVRDLLAHLEGLPQVAFEEIFMGAHEVAQEI